MYFIITLFYQILGICKYIYQKKSGCGNFIFKYWVFKSKIIVLVTEINSY